MQAHMRLHRPPDPIDIPGPLQEPPSFSDRMVGGSHNLPGSLLSNAYPRPGDHTAPTMSYADSKKFVVFEASPATCGQTFRCSIFAPLVISLEKEDSVDPEHPIQLTTNTAKNDGDTTYNGKNRSSCKNKARGMHPNRSTNAASIPVTASKKPDHISATIDVPKPEYEIDKSFPSYQKIIQKENSVYLRFIEKTTEELEEIVEYDLDEEDLSWLSRINKKQAEAMQPTVQQSTLEWIIDRFEKSAKFRPARSSEVTGSSFSP
ncbi:unnamed protein product, partial [Protopolystoma xenopodis]